MKNLFCEYVQVGIDVLAVAYGLALVRVGRGRRLPDWAGHVVPPAHTHTYIVRHLEYTQQVRAGGIC